MSGSDGTGGRAGAGNRSARPTSRSRVWIGSAAQARGRRGAGALQARGHPLRSRTGEGEPEPPVAAHHDAHPHPPAPGTPAVEGDHGAGEVRPRLGDRAPGPESPQDEPWAEGHGEDGAPQRRPQAPRRAGAGAGPHLPGVGASLPQDAPGHGQRRPGRRDVHHAPGAVKDQHAVVGHPGTDRQRSVGRSHAIQRAGPGAASPPKAAPSAVARAGDGGVAAAGARTTRRPDRAPRPRRRRRPRARRSPRPRRPARRRRPGPPGRDRRACRPEGRRRCRPPATRSPRRRPTGTQAPPGEHRPARTAPARRPAPGARAAGTGRQRDGAAQQPARHADRHVPRAPEARRGQGRSRGSRWRSGRAWGPSPCVRATAGAGHLARRGRIGPPRRGAAAPGDYPPLAMCFEPDSRPPPLPDGLGVTAMGGAAAELLTLTSADGTRFSAALAEPPRPRGPAVVILPDVRGLYRFYVELAERFAQAGHPRSRSTTSAARPARRARQRLGVLPLVMQTRVEEVQADTAAAIAALRERTGARRSHRRLLLRRHAIVHGRHQRRARPRRRGGLLRRPRPRRVGCTGADKDVAARRAARSSGCSAEPTRDPARAHRGYERAFRRPASSTRSSSTQARRTRSSTARQEHAEACEDAWRRVLGFLQNVAPPG